MGPRAATEDGAWARDGDLAPSLPGWVVTKWKVKGSFWVSRERSYSREGARNFQNRMFEDI